jgi:UDP-GlcNAc:undecaprenyl-phosphate GlcNAc-1-phosphate transferase
MSQIYNLIFCISLSIFVIFINNLFRKQISNFTGLADTPDKIRKFHKKTTPLIGSFPIVISSLIYIFFFKEENIYFIHITLVSIFFFVIGLIDDKYNIKYQNKFFLTALISFFFLYFNENFLINSIYFETFEINKTLIKSHSIILTIVCIIILINTFNFTDGINGLSSLIAVVWLGSLLLFSQSTLILVFLIIICLILNSFPIFKGNYFLGDSGTLFLSSFISLTTVYIFNTRNLISYEEIFLVFMIPGLDMIRLVVIRLKNQKNPFLPDRNHLHHYLIRKYSLTRTLFIYTLIMTLPIMLKYLIGVQLSILTGIVIYFTVVLKFNKI